MYVSVPQRLGQLGTDRSSRLLDRIESQRSILKAHVERKALMNDFIRFVQIQETFHWFPFAVTTVSMGVKHTHSKPWQWECKQALSS